MKPQTCMLISGIVNIIHALLFLLSILALLGIGSLGLIASVDGIHGLVGLTMLVVAVPLLLGLPVTVAAIVLAFKSRGEGRQNLMVACTICSAVGIFLGNWLIGLVATGFAGVGVYLAMRGPKNYSSGPI